MAAPVAWEEMDGLSAANIYSIRDAATLIERSSSDLLKGWGQAKQTLPDL